MKLHRPVWQALIHCLEAVFKKGEYADKVLEREFKKQKRFGSRDRRLLAESFYNSIRYWRLLCYWAKKPETEIASVMDIFFAAGLTIEDIKKNEAKAPWEIQESYPEPFLGQIQKERKNDFKEVFSALNREAPVFLRVNTLKSDVATVMKGLSHLGIESKPVDGLESGIRLLERKNIFQTELFKNGLIEVQDGGSQLIAPFVNPEPGDRIIDACAGAGGKALHMAALMKNKGKIIAMDIHEWKLNELKKRARRAGVDIIETRLIESGKTIKRLFESADRLLLDVPCSGSGVLRRQPDTKWRWRESEFMATLKTQAEILGSYPSMLKKGGILVYATCSVFPSENHESVKSFISTHLNYHLEKELELLPTNNDFDGFYAARLTNVSK